jgi:hypothetical protein
MIPATPPPNDDVIVVTVAFPAYIHLVPLMPKVLPALKAKKAHHNMKRPIKQFLEFPLAIRSCC